MIRAGDVAKVLVSFQEFQVSLRANAIVSAPLLRDTIEALRAGQFVSVR